LSSTTKTTKSEPAPVETDPRDVELAALRAELETVKAAVGRLQELAANALKPCPCGMDTAQGDRRSFFLMNGTLFCDSGHFSHFGAGQ
jgi:hypothetical protein